MTWFGHRKGDYDPPLVKPAPDNVVKFPQRLRGPEHIERTPAEEDCDAVEVFKQILAGLEPTETLVIYVVDENDELV
jgi:hypothetical protein